MKTYAELVDELERYKQVMNRILEMDEDESILGFHGVMTVPVSIKEAKKLIRGLDDPEQNEIILTQEMIDEAYEKIVHLMSNV